MSEARPRPEPEALLAHRDFVRGLAMKLVFDEHKADDVVQETWLAALENAPAQPRSLRAWLARVARNLALKSARTDIRRRQRERRNARPDETPSALDTLERIALERRVIDAVLALDEPYRTTLVLRFYEDLPPREIAKRMDENSATVRTRLKRGLDMLRARFDRESGSSRTWMLSLLPLLVPTVPAASAATTSGGILFMSAKKTLAATAAIAATLLGVLYWNTTQSHSSNTQPRAESHAARAAEASPDSTAAREEESSEPTGPAVPLVVRVIDARGAPVNGATVERIAETHVQFGVSIRPDWYRLSRTPNVLQRSTTDASARFVATKSGFARAENGPVVVRAEADARDVEIVLSPAHPLRGRVTDGEGQPVEGAVVLAAEARVKWDYLYVAPPVRSITDENGAYEFTNLPPQDVALFAARSGTVPFHIRTIDFPTVAEFDIVLARGGTIRGRVVDDETHKPIAGARVQVNGSNQHRSAATTNAQGEYVIDSLPPTMVIEITAERDGYYQIRKERTSPAPQIRLAKGDSLRRDLHMRPGSRVYGVVRGPDGPIAGLTLQALETRANGIGDMRQCRTGRDGEYALFLRPGRSVFQVGSVQLTFAKPPTIDVPHGDALEHDVILVKNEAWSGSCAVEGRVLDSSGEGVPNVRVQMHVHSASTDVDGRFQLTGLPAGVNVLLAYRPGWRLLRPERVTLAEEEPTNGVVVRMERIPDVTGVVRGEDLDGPFVLIAAMNEAQTGGGSIALSNAWARLWYRARRVPVRPDGSYTIDHVPAVGRVFVRAGAMNAALSKPVEIKAPGPHNFNLERGDVIAGRVIDSAHGKAVAGAQIQLKALREHDPSPLHKAWFNDRDQIVVAVSDERGRFEVRHCIGEYQIRAKAPDHMQLKAIPAQAGTRNLEVVMDPALELRGTVHYKDGDPATGLRVFANRVGKKYSQWCLGTSPQGHFTVRNLSPGEYRLTVGGEAALTRTVGPFVAGTDGITIRLERAGPGEGEGWPKPQDGDGEIRGRVVDPHGNGLAGFRVWAASADKPKRNLGQRTAVTGKGGGFAIRGLAAGTYRVSASARGTLMLSIRESVAPGTRNLEFVFDSIAGVLVDDRGKPMPQRTIRAIRIEDPVQTRDGLSDEKGIFRIDGLIPGEYRLRITRSTQHKAVRITPAQTKTGVADLRLTADLGARISGTVSDENGAPISYAWVAVDETGSHNAARTDAKGRFEISGLESGRKYPIRVKAEGHIARAFEAVAAGTNGLHIAMSKGLWAEGRLVDAEGNLLRNASIRCASDGDQAWVYGRTDGTATFRVSGLREADYHVQTLQAAKGGGLKWLDCGRLRGGQKGVELKVAPE